MKKIKDLLSKVKSLCSKVIKWVKTKATSLRSKIKGTLNKAKELSVKYMDKITHFLAGYVFSDLLWYVFPFWAVFVSVGIIATAKEGYDWKYGGTGFDWKDLISTVAGCLVFICIKLLLWVIIF